LKEFVRVIKEATPRCFVMEEVDCLQSARFKHVKIAERGVKGTFTRRRKKLCI
jgi:DNA (cytosine-5)-methyltransferase 1